MLKQAQQNDRGIVFVTVLMIIIVMVIISLSIVSINVSQVISTEEAVKRAQAETIAWGALVFGVANQLSSTPGNRISYNEPDVNNTNNPFVVDIDFNATGSVPPNSNSAPVEIQVSF